MVLVLLQQPSIPFTHKNKLFTIKKSSEFSNIFFVLKCEQKVNSLSYCFCRQGFLIRNPVEQSSANRSLILHKYIIHTSQVKDVDLLFKFFYLNWKGPGSILLCPSRMSRMFEPPNYPWEAIKRITCKQQ